MGKVLADESKENGISINLGPGGNLHRNILCGRHPEYYSEDPILTGTLMAYQARGLEENGVIATYKHLIANNMEFERKSAHGIIAVSYTHLEIKIENLKKDVVTDNTQPVLSFSLRSDEDGCEL